MGGKSRNTSAMQAWLVPTNSCQPGGAARVGREGLEELPSDGSLPGTWARPQRAPAATAGVEGAQVSRDVRVLYLERRKPAELHSQT